MKLMRYTWVVELLDVKVNKKKNSYSWTLELQEEEQFIIVGTGSC